MEIYNKSFGDNHPDSADVFLSLAQLLQTKGEYDRDYSTDSNNIQEHSGEKS